MAKHLIEEVTFEKPDLGITVRGKIYEVRGRRTSTYEYDVSHHYYPAPGAGLYISSVISGGTPEYAKALLEKYVRGMRLPVEKNPYYR